LHSLWVALHEVLAAHRCCNVWTFCSKGGVAKFTAEGEVEDEAHIFEVPRGTAAFGEPEI
jgi:hypothetical protein